MHTFSAGKDGGRGLLSAVRFSIPSSRISLPTDPSGRIQSLSMKMKVHGAWLSMVNIYLPRGAFVENCSDYLLCTMEPPFLFFGDFNINLL